MSATMGMTHDGQYDLQLETRELQLSSLRLVIVSLLCIGWALCWYSLLWPGHSGPMIRPTIILYVAAFGAFTLAKDYYHMACVVLLIGAAFALAAVGEAYPSAFVHTCGAVIVIYAYALLGMAGAIFGAIFTWAVVTKLLAFGLAGVVLAATGVSNVLSLYLLVAAAIGIVTWPLRAYMKASLVAWSQLRQAMVDARERRAELHRTLHSLEEATFRIERANNELSIAQHEAQEARAIKARFVATVSHELRSPLNLILGFSRLMALSPESYGGPLPAVYRADMDAIYRNTQHLASLVDDVLDLSQVEAQQLPLIRERIDLIRDVVVPIVDIVKPLADRKRLYLEQELASQPLWLIADQTRLRQVLLNLLTNAVRFTDRGGITLRVVLHDSECAVSVQDTGRGIAEEAIPRLFQEFSQIHRTETREERGSGLGLAIAKHLISSHGGQIWAESQLGQGSTVHFTLPLPETGSLVSPLVSTRGRKAASAHDTLLVVHDDQAVARLLGRHLEGYRIATAADAVSLPELPELIEQLRPKAILCGPESVERVRTAIAMTPFDIPIVSHSMPRLSEDPRLADVRSYIVKPVEPALLARVMKQVQREQDMKVLIVDDDPDAVRLIERMLRGISDRYRILKAYDGAQALETIQQALPDLVLLDLAIPEVDGFEVLQRIRSSPSTRDVAVVVISASDWIGEQASIGPSLEVHHRRRPDMTRGIACLEALLSALHPEYVADPGVSPAFAVTPPG